MKFNVRKSLSALMATAMVAGTIAVPSMAAVTQEGDVTSPNGVVSPVFSIGVPTEVSLTFDPLKLGDDAKQVVSGDYVFTNNSNVVAAIDVSVYPALATGVSLVAADTDVPEKAGNTDKVMNLFVTHAIAQPTEGENNSINVDYGVDATESDPTTKMIGKLSADHSYDFTIVLAAGTASDGTATPHDDLGSSAFSFDGVINPNASWAANDVILTTVFKATALSADSAIESYAKLEDFDEAHPDVGFQTYKETNWGTEFRTYTASATGIKTTPLKIDLNTATKATFTGAASVKVTSDAAGKTAYIAFKYDTETGAITYSTDTKAKAGLTITAYAHAFDAAGTIIATVPLNIYIVA